MTTLCKRIRDGKPCDRKLTLEDQEREHPAALSWSCPELHDADRRLLFEDRLLTVDEEAIRDMLPRVGFGMRCHAMGSNGGLLSGTSMTWADRDGRSLGDLRKLNQDETDSLIVRELHQHCPKSELEDLRRLWPTLIEVVHYLEDDSGRQDPWWFDEQRGGIHSDPLIRILASRTWGRRDANWTPPAAIASRLAKPSKSMRRPTESQPRAYLHQAGCNDPSCDGQCVSR